MPLEWQAEIKALHQFFEAWLGGTLPQTQTTFERLTRVLEPSFCLIGPDGKVTARDDLIASLYEAHGSRGVWRIWIENPALRFEAGELLLATYEEWQERSGVVTARLSSVLFKKDEQAPNGLSWMHVHETWLENPARR